MTNNSQILDVNLSIPHPWGVVTREQTAIELNAKGWYQVRPTGSHQIFRLRERRGIVVEPNTIETQSSKSTLASTMMPVGLQRRA